MDGDMCGLRRFHGIPFIGFGNIKNCHIRAKQGQGNCFFPAGAAYIGYPNAFKTIKVIRIPPKHGDRVLGVLLCPFFRCAGMFHPEIVRVKFPSLFMLLAASFVNVTTKMLEGSTDKASTR